MPLHLLSKKSWNVYAPANRARVARDEALAEAAARDAERDRRDGESTARIDALRDDAVADSLEQQETAKSTDEQEALLLKVAKDLTTSRDGESKKRKRLAGEDDTDRDLRYAREDQARRGERAVAKLQRNRAGTSDAPMVDARGHINLFPEHKPRKHDNTRKSELQRERDQQREAQEQQGMQLKHALGMHKSGNGAWYLDKDGGVKDAAGKDVWGNEDPRRMHRQEQRMVSSDPLAFMKKAQAQLVESRRDKEQREAELSSLRRRGKREFDDFKLDDEEPRRHKHKNHRRKDEADRDHSRQEHRDHRDDKRSRRHDRDKDDRDSSRRR